MTTRDYIVDSLIEIVWDDMSEWEAEGSTDKEKDDSIREALELNVETYADTLTWFDILFECGDNDLGETFVEVAKSFGADVDTYEEILTNKSYAKSMLVHYFLGEIYDETVRRYGHIYDYEDEEEE